MCKNVARSRLFSTQCPLYSTIGARAQCPLYSTIGVRAQCLLYSTIMVLYSGHCVLAPVAPIDLRMILEKSLERAKICLQDVSSSYMMMTVMLM